LRWSLRPGSPAESKRPDLSTGPAQVWCTAKDSNLQPID
jgi:hypothetical protein